MPRKYERTSKRNTWKKESMDNAIEAVKKGEMGLKTAATQFGVPRSTLRRRVDGKNVHATGSSTTLGRFTPTFPPEIENDLAAHILKLEEMMFGIGIKDVRTLAFQLAEKNNIPHRFSNELAGKDWVYGFLSRHKELAIRTPEATSTLRARGFNRVIVTKFFDVLEKLMEEHNFPPNRVFNVDETGLSTVQSRPSKIIALKGRHQIGSITSAERGQLVTVEICMNATGMFVPPLFIFPRQRMKEALMDGAPPGSIYACHKSGWMQKDIFYQWFQHFVTVVGASKNNPALLVLDGHSTHTTNIDVIDFARDNGVYILCLPSHCTHRLQPLDVSFMKPLSTYYNQAVETWLRNHPGRAVTTYQVAALFQEAYLRSSTSLVAANGFRKTGIYPVNRYIFEDHDFAPSEVTDKDEESVENDSIEDETPSYVDDRSCEQQSCSAQAPRYISPSDIAKIPRSLDQGGKRKRRCVKSSATLLTCSPYKKALLDAAQAKTEKAKEKERRKKLREEKRRENAKSKSKTPKPSLKNVDPQSSSDENEEECLFCQEVCNDDGWIRCSVCNKWAHDQCAGIDSDDGDDDDDENYICDLCR